MLARIQTYDPSWEGMVPAQIVEIIKRDKLFGFRKWVADGKKHC